MAIRKITDYQGPVLAIRNITDCHGPVLWLKGIDIFVTTMLLLVRKPEKLQENQTPIRFFFSSNITNSNIVVTNMAIFQCNYSISFIRRKPIN